jgi:hypothetical protein
MPVYLCTTHAYRSWEEDHPNGYVQRDEGLKPPSENLRRWRSEHALHEPVRFSKELQSLIIDVVEHISIEKCARLHAVAATRTHVHSLISFRSPACICGVSEHCWRNCASRAFAEKFIIRAKQKCGQAIAQHQQTKGRPWFSRGWDLTPVRNKSHFDYLITTYLPKHEKRENGMLRIF